MAVIIGSARADENGKYVNGKPGDQRSGLEVSTQNWYLHSKGWRVIRAVNSKVADKIASTMEDICASKYVGYAQNTRNQLYDAASKVDWDCKKIKTNVNTDCSAAVRVCVRAATGVSVPDFNTTFEISTLLSLKKNGKALFKEMTGYKYTSSPDLLKRGDILVTCQKGHTVVVLSNGSKVVSVKNAVTDVVEAVKKDVTTDIYTRYYGRCSSGIKSLVEGLISVGEKDTSLSKRSKIAKANGISNYTGTVTQNTKLLGYLKKGTLKKA